MSFLYFSWVDASETTFGVEHQVEDELVFHLRIAQVEGDFARASVTIKNPRIGLLAPGRQRWAWISFDTGATAGVRPLFFGRLLAHPVRLEANIVTLEFLARPSDFDAQRDALADTLKVQPFFDPVWLDGAVRDDPDAVLEGRSATWHVDRTTHVLTISDITAGEAGVIDFGAGGTVFYNSLQAAPLRPPLRRVRIEAEVLWDQAAAGVVDLKLALIAAFKAAGTTKPHVITTYTGTGLQEDWPEDDTPIGSGWRVGSSSVRRLDGKAIVAQGFFSLSRVARVGVKAPLWTFAPTFTVAYDAERARSETIGFTLEAETQAMMTEEGDEEVLLIAVSTFDISEPIDDLGTAGFGTPMSDRRRNSFWLTDRGKDSLEHLLLRARAELLARARAVEVKFKTTWLEGLDVTLRHSARVADPRLPGGEATGKVTRYIWTVDGGTGLFEAEITIGCSVGQGTTISAVAGVPTYVDLGYVDAGYQVLAGDVIVPLSGEVGYTDYDDLGPPNDGVADDGINFLAMTPAAVILSFQVFDGQAAQEVVLGKKYESMTQAIDALLEAFTEVDLSLVPLDTGPFVHDIEVVVTKLAVPKTIDLEAP